MLSEADHCCIKPSNASSGICRVRLVFAALAITRDRSCVANQVIIHA